MYYAGRVGVEGAARSHPGLPQHRRGGGRQGALMVIGIIIVICIVSFVYVVIINNDTSIMGYLDIGAGAHGRRGGRRGGWRLLHQAHDPPRHQRHAGLPGGDLRPGHERHHVQDGGGGHRHREQHDFTPPLRAIALQYTA